jgi:hypothetical protein
MSDTSPEAQPRQDHPDDEAIPFLIVVDCVASPADHDGILPFAIVLDEIKQALAAREGMDAVLAHVAIRENRDDILHAVQAAADEEDRRRG